MLRIGAVLLAGVASAVPVVAQERQIAEGLPEVRLTLNGAEVLIGRAEAECPPDCVQPMRASQGVETLGALEVIWLLQTEVSVGAGLVVDVRLPQDFAAGHVPGAVNVPGVTLAPGNPSLKAILMAFGAAEAGGTLEFASVRPLTVYGAGPGQADAAAAIRSLVEQGFPAGKLRYFRGGMQEWLQFGLTVSNPGQGG